MPENELPNQIYIGTWCYKESENIKAFFDWYFRNSLKNRKDFPQNLTDEQWLEEYKTYREIKHA